LLFAYSNFAWSVLVVSDFWALAVNSLGGLIIFRKLGAYVDYSGTLLPTLWVHLSALDILGMKRTLVFHTGMSGMVIRLLNVVVLPTTYLL
jgi:hypothetical protein